MSWISDRRHDIERYFKRQIRDRLIAQAKDFWLDIEPELEEILEEAETLGESVLAELVDLLRADLITSARRKLDDLRERIDKRL